MKPKPLEFHEYRGRFRPRRIEAARVASRRRVMNPGGRVFMVRAGDYLVRVGQRVQRVDDRTFEQLYEKVG